MSSLMIYVDDCGWKRVGECFLLRASQHALYFRGTDASGKVEVSKEIGYHFDGQDDITVIGSVSAVATELGLLVLKPVPSAVSAFGQSALEPELLEEAIGTEVDFADVLNTLTSEGRGEAASRLLGAVIHHRASMLGTAKLSETNVERLAEQLDDSVCLLLSDISENIRWDPEVFRQLREYIATEGLVFVFSGKSAGCEQFLSDFKRILLDHDVAPVHCLFRGEEWKEILEHRLAIRTKRLLHYDVNVELTTFLCALAFASYKAIREHEAANVEALDKTTLADVRDDPVLFSQYFFAKYHDGFSDSKAEAIRHLVFVLWNILDAAELDASLFLYVLLPSLSAVLFSDDLDSEFGEQATLPDPEVVRRTRLAFCIAVHDHAASIRRRKDDSDPRVNLVVQTGYVREILQGGRTDHLVKRGVAVVPYLRKFELEAHFSRLASAGRVPAGTEGQLAGKVHGLTGGHPWLTKSLLAFLLQAEDKYSSIDEALIDARGQMVELISNPLGIADAPGRLVEEWVQYRRDLVTRFGNPIPSSDQKILTALVSGPPNDVVDQRVLPRLGRWLETGLVRLVPDQAAERLLTFGKRQYPRLESPGELPLLLLEELAAGGLVVCAAAGAAS